MRIALIVAGLLLAASVLTPVIVAHRSTLADAEWREPPASVTLVSAPSAPPARLDAAAPGR